jgi:hypothetical protein
MKKSVPIDLLNPTALASIVSATMGLEVNPRLGLPGIKAKMAQAGFPTDFIEYDDGKEEGEPVRVEPPRVRHRPGKRSVQLRIELQEKPGGAEPVFSSVNGVNILIPRATTCWVDFKYYHALMNAVAHIAEVDENLNITGYRKVPEYPVSVFHIEPPLTAAEKTEAARMAVEAAARASEEAEAA